MKYLNCFAALSIWCCLIPSTSAEQNDTTLKVHAESETFIIAVDRRTGGFTDAHLEEINLVSPRITLVSAKPSEFLGLVEKSDALIGSCDVEAVRAGTKLRWVQTYSAGVEKCMFPELVNSEITLTNGKIIQGPQIADHAMGLLLSLTRGLNQAIFNQQKKLWVRYNEANSARYYERIELRGKVALIIGLGGIGTQVAERAAAFGMQVLALDPKDIPYLTSVRKVGKPDQLHEFLPLADVVFMCAPHTPKTEHMLSAKEFALMKQGTYFINVSRGKTVDTEALVSALKAGKLAGAGLDVTDPEPLPKDHALWELDNVVLTPHVAYQSDQIVRRRVDLVKENVRRFALGLPLRNVVKKAKGY